MADPYLSEIRIMSFNFAPNGWALCNGQMLPINQNQALFTLLGTTYGGDGEVNFGLPNLQGRAPIHTDNDYPLGEVGGEQSHTLLLGEMPAHVHAAMASPTNGDQAAAVGNYLGPGNELYAPTGTTTTLVPGTVASSGGGQAHTNMQPYLVLSFCIALQGIFPSQN